MQAGTFAQKFVVWLNIHCEEYWNNSSASFLFQLHDRLSKVLGELSEEREMNKSLRRNQADWQSKVADLEKQIEDKNKVKRFNFRKEI